MKTKSTGLKKKQSVQQDEERLEKRQKIAWIVNSSTASAWRIIAIMQSDWVGEDLDALAVSENLQAQADAVQSGDLSQVECMLINQAAALQSIFVRFAEKAMEQQYIPSKEMFLKLSLRAQSQCRATLETLASIKNPPVVYARQANVTTGPQQVNNGVPSRVREKEIAQNQLSGDAYELPPDTRTSSNACGIDTQLETVGKINRAKVYRG